jgi:hypothetical protein
MEIMLTSDEAVVTKQQHMKPCSDCPWRKNSIRGWLGPLGVIGWLRVARGDSNVTCHTLKKPTKGHWQCAGIATYRANTCKIPKDPLALRLPSSKDVFTFGEFEKYHDLKQVFKSIRSNQLTKKG